MSDFIEDIEFEEIEKQHHFVSEGDVKPMVDMDFIPAGVAAYSDEMERIMFEAFNAAFNAYPGHVEPVFTAGVDPASTNGDKTAITIYDSKNKKIVQ